MVPNKNIHEFDQKKLSELISAWEQYYENQESIFVINVPSLFEDACEAVGAVEKDTVFIVVAPLTFLHLHDFKNGIGRAKTHFCFMKDGFVLTEENTGMGRITYSEAFTQIVKRVTGTYGADIPVVPDTPILDEQREQALTAKLASFEQNIALWIEKLNKLPAVYRAVRYEGDNTQRLIEVDLFTNSPNEDTIHCIGLSLGSVVDNTEYYDGEVSSMYTKWASKHGVDMSNPTLTWEQFYQAAVELSEQYVSVPEV